MEIKLKDVKGYINAINALSGEKIPLKAAFKLAKLKKEMIDQAEFYDNHFRKIIMDNAELDENGNPVSKDNGVTVQIKSDRVQEANRLLKELNELTAEISDYKFNIEDFGNIEISTDTLGNLIDFIEE